MTDPVTESETSPQKAFFNGAAHVGVQAVLFNNDRDAIWRAVTSLARSAELGIRSGLLSKASLHLGDSSPQPSFSQSQIQEMQFEFSGSLEIVYTFFDANLGTARGHNRLATGNHGDFLVLQNPDIVMSPHTLEILIEGFRTPGIGMVEPKQLPIEHPKNYDPLTGETSWATGACGMIPAALFHKLGGYDADSFFLYCDDVDLSWRVRLVGYKVIFQPAAMVFHDKRLSNDGKWMPTSAERYYSAEAALLLAHKWSRPDLVQSYLEIFERIDDADLKKARETYMDRLESGSLPDPIDASHSVAQFIDGQYARHRFAL